MKVGVVAKKVGMTMIFADNGDAIAVTVVEVEANRVTQVKNIEKDGYVAVQMAVGERKSSRVNKALAGHCEKAGVRAGAVTAEVRYDGSDTMPDLGKELDVLCFDEGQVVDVTGRSKGKGFQGGVIALEFCYSRCDTW